LALRDLAVSIELLRPESPSARLEFEEHFWWLLELSGYAFASDSCDGRCRANGQRKAALLSTEEAIVCQY
jgi:hypothetical protein